MACVAGEPVPSGLTAYYTVNVAAYSSYLDCRPSDSCLISAPNANNVIGGRCAAYHVIRPASAPTRDDTRGRKSGSSIRGRPCLSKAGSPCLRKALHLPALAALRFNPAVAALRRRLQVADKPGKLIVGAAMRKLLRIVFGVFHSGRPFDASVCPARETCSQAPSALRPATRPRVQQSPLDRQHRISRISRRVSVCKVHQVIEVVELQCDVQRRQRQRGFIPITGGMVPFSLLGACVDFNPCPVGRDEEITLQ